MTPKRLLAAVVWTLGVAALAVAAGVAVAPAATTELLPAVGSLTELLWGFDERVLLAAVAAVTGLLALAFSRVGVSGDPATEPAMDGRRGQAVEAVAVPPETITGSGLDRAFDQVRDTDELAGVAGRLRATAVAVERTAAGVDRETARDRVARGAWTDDDLAAAVLGESVPVPVVARLRAWLDEEREARRRLRRTVTAVETRLEDGSTGGEGGASA